MKLDNDLIHEHLASENPVGVGESAESRSSAGLHGRR